MTRKIEAFRWELLGINMDVAEGRLFCWALDDWQSDNRSLAEPGEEEKVLTARLSPSDMWHIERGGLRAVWNCNYRYM